MSAGSAILCYDANGNRSQKIDGSTTNYAYDAENQPGNGHGRRGGPFSPETRREKPFHLRAGGVIICLRVQ